MSNAHTRPPTGPPLKFGRYQLASLIGRGGMAELFRARLETPAGAEKILVVKRILPSFSSDPEFLRLFVNEAKIALPLTHGNITSVFEFGEVDGQYFLAMEYIHGQNVHAILERLRKTALPMPVAAALFVASEVAKGLAYAHGFISPQGTRMEVVHLDVTPHNILVSYDGTVKLTDFGIAKVKQSAEPSRAVLRGKVDYLAPEQVRGGPVDGRTDVFSLGAVLYEMLTGHAPFSAPSDEETLAKIERGEVRRPSELRSELAELDELVLRALATDPAARYARAADLQVAVNQALFRKNPKYGSLELAEWLRELFAWDLFESQSAESENALRDRLLFQLTNAKVDVDPSKSTRELLSLGTVSIPPPPPPPALVADPERRRGAIIGAAIAAAAVGLLGVLAVLLGKHFFGEEVAWLGTAATEKPVLAAISADGAVKSGGTGALSLNAWPSAIVYLDGERIPGVTPILNFTVSEGKHRLLFVRPELDLQKEVEVVVPAGGVRTVAVTLDAK